MTNIKGKSLAHTEDRTIKAEAQIEGIKFSFGGGHNG
jgi:hypothetical protein